MSSFYARCVGLAGQSELSPEAAILVFQRRTTLSHNEARVAVYDYLGVTRGQLSKQMGVTFETIRTYWKRIHRKTGLRTRKDIRAWVEQILRREIEGDSSS